jgi:beta-glucosidase
MPRYNFPENFLWGCAAASYQIEGARDADGKGRSIWDTLCERPGAIKNGDSGQFACDHYNRWEEDLDIIKNLGIGAYRFSISWPRVFPQGRGSVNAKGLDFYDRLVDGMLARGITPCATCYHWDLPQALEDKGGWRERATSEAFAEYCRVVAERLGDRVEMWFTLNEPVCSWYMGHVIGRHAPGAKEPEQVHRQVMHHLHLAHGLGARALREGASKPIRVGLVHNPYTCEPFFESAENINSARKLFEEKNAWILDPVMKGRYPEAEWQRLGDDVPRIKDGDLEIINASVDFLALNLYSMPNVVRAELNEPVRDREKQYPRTDFDWPVTPDGLYWTLRFANEIYNPETLYITENGCCYPDEVNKDGLVEDYARVEYLRGYLKGLHRSVDEGIPVKGYFIWSILDNFEWAEGYSKRFGIVHVNYETQKRTPKASAEWYKRLIEAGGF